MENNWISVKERLPEYTRLYNVLCESDTGKITHSLWFKVSMDKNKKSYWCFDSQCNPVEGIFETSWYLEVTHWQPLPEPPKL